MPGKSKMRKHFFMKNSQMFTQNYLRLLVKHSACIKENFKTNIWTNSHWSGFRNKGCRLCLIHDTNCYVHLWNKLDAIETVKNMIPDIFYKIWRMYLKILVWWYVLFVVCYWFWLSLWWLHFNILCIALGPDFRFLYFKIF